ncbi:VWA domain-containing protein [Thiohalomonas denitrificans]|uniref:VWA domain-containing protein n=1 Tax=Thiohalomonas denitrificans TaxID=415747 RepID=UPI0026F0012D|nr:VWA domain-containing protein [Thiohalomonas denitrificans]
MRLTLLLLWGLFASPIASAAVDLRVNSQVDPIELYVTVTDADGHYVNNLTQNDFKIVENGVEKIPSSFTPPANGSNQVSLSVVFVIDNSSSLDTVNEEIEDSVVSFIRSMNLNDRFGLVKFRGEIDVTDFMTIDPENTTAAEEAVRKELNPESDSPVFDALIAALDLFEGATLPAGPRAIVLLSDGRNNSSETTLDGLLDRIVSSGIPVFTVGFGYTNTSVLTQIAQAGGTDYIAGQDANAFEVIQSEVAELLQNRYSLTYTSSIAIDDCRDVPLSLEVSGEPAQEMIFDRCGSSNRAPQIQSEKRKSFTIGQEVSLAIEAIDPDGGVLTFSARNLPTGLSIDSRTGLISGTANELGSYDVQVAVTDGEATSRIAFTADVVDPVSETSNDSGGAAAGPWALLLMSLLLGWRALPAGSLKRKGG